MCFGKAEQHPIAVQFVGRAAKSCDQGVVERCLDDKRISNERRALAREAAKNGVDSRASYERRHHMGLLAQDLR